ncbi:hypothetical protein LG047_15395 [Methylocystis sp. WRRC1]|uniref:P22 phage major capsid protein family protein n=1 Tax=Methylocystis sp. WRRC1 TaxID=1732014 RepID=UPI001D1505CD|nr:P22 phage major capsid protein family protein [Methylocystis sp. WRRC1]MCC3246685.1 hypothetical protein [Methylocystis sp. WRRC1]
MTGLVPDLYEAIDIVSRELVGFIPAVTMDANAARAAVNEEVRVPIAPAAAAADVTPGQLPPDTGDQTIGYTPIKITKSRVVPFRWTGEEQQGVNNGVGYRNIRRDQIAQAVRTLVNEVENDLGGLYIRASRAYGTAGTTPFASDLSDPAQVRKILADNGAPMSDLQMIINTTAGAKLRSLAQLNKANEAGTTELRSQGMLLDLHGFIIRESNGVASVTKGTGASYLVNNASGYAAGDTTIALDTGSGTVLAGDVVTFGSDTNKYVVGTALSAGSLVLNAPGMRQTLADNTAMTVGNNYTANMAFSRSAMVLVARAPALPEEGDMADDRMTITDPRSGMSFEFAMYRQYRRVRYEVSLAWGVANIKPQHTALLLG